MTQFVVYQIWDTSISVPGGRIKSRHSTLAEAEAAKAQYEAAESTRQAKPVMSVAAADAAIADSYGYPLGGEPLAEARHRLRHRSRHAYEVRETKDPNQGDER